MNNTKKITEIKISDKVKHPRLGIWYYPPRTLRDHFEIELRCWAGKPNDDIFRIMQDPNWRSEVEEFRGHMFCHKCDQLIVTDHCAECRQVMVGSIPTVIDCMPAVPTTRMYLEYTSKLMLRFFVSPAVTLKVLHALNEEINRTFGRASFTPEVIDEIFNQAGAAEAERREELRGA